MLWPSYALSNASMAKWQRLISLKSIFSIFRFDSLLKLQYFFQDYEVKNRYQVHTYVVFCDQESIQRVPRAGQSFYIPAPVIEDKPGGPGLDDIRHLLDITDRDESFDFPSASSPEIRERVIGARIERACMFIHCPLNLLFY